MLSNHDSRKHISQRERSAVTCEKLFSGKCESPTVTLQPKIHLWKCRLGPPPLIVSTQENVKGFNIHKIQLYHIPACRRSELEWAEQLFDLMLDESHGI